MNLKKQIREKFRNEVFKRAKYCCQFCGQQGQCRQTGEGYGKVELDAHHIRDRSEFRFGGYVKENGISLCDWCHNQAEKWHKDGIGAIGLLPDDLYRIIGSNFEKAKEQDEKQTDSNR